MTTLLRLAKVAGAFAALPAAVVLAALRFDLSTTATVLYAVAVIPASGVIAICTAAAPLKAAREKAGTR